MRTFELTIDITASKKSVWDTLVDFESYQVWNSLVTVKGRLEAGGELVFSRKSTESSISAWVMDVEQGEKYVLSRSLLHRSCVYMEHHFELSEIDSTTTRFTQRWDCWGFLLPFLWPNMTRRFVTFERFNNELKSYAEIERGGN